jgi:hypothetical protein
MNIEKYGNTTSALPLVLYDFEHLFKKEIQLFWLLWDWVHVGSVYLKWAYDKNNCKLKQINMDLKEIQNLIKFSKFRCCRLKWK